MNSNSDHYFRTISVSAQPQEIYRALTTGYQDWWTTTGGKQFNTVGDRVKFTFPPLVSYWTFEAKVLDPDMRVELECVDAYHELADKPDAAKDEWLGSRMIFQIVPRGNKTDVHFHHQGLTSHLDCYEVCEQGWDHFFVDSLRVYLNTGVGKPYINSK